MQLYLFDFTQETHLTISFIYFAVKSGTFGTSKRNITKSTKETESPLFCISIFYKRLNASILEQCLNSKFQKNQILIPSASRSKYKNCFLSNMEGLELKTFYFRIVKKLTLYGIRQKPVARECMENI